MVPNLVDSAKFIYSFLLKTSEVSPLFSSVVLAMFFSYLAREATSFVCLLSWVSFKICSIKLSVVSVLVTSDVSALLFCSLASCSWKCLVARAYYPWILFFMRVVVSSVERGWGMNSVWKRLRAWQAFSAIIFSSTFIAIIRVFINAWKILVLHNIKSIHLNCRLRLLQELTPNYWFFILMTPSAVKSKCLWI